jgi:3-dehydroquinate synthase
VSSAASATTRPTAATSAPPAVDPPPIDLAAIGSSAVLTPGSLVRLGALARAAAPAYRYVIITDDHVGPLYADQAVASFGGDRVDVLTITAGEHSKTRASWAALTDDLLAIGCGRDTCVIALGGGVIGDLAGFVAATFMRGVPVVQVPTTLVAMIDAAIGGKTGVDTAAGKNLVGTFHDPAAVIIDPLVLRTLPPAQLRAGLAEAIKHGVIADRSYFEQTAAALPLVLSPNGTTTPSMAALIAGSIAIKAGVVASDAKETGRRKILNFGHTIGHAVEAASDYAILHGEAVAIGMVLEARLAERFGLASPGIASRIGATLAAADLPTSLPPGAIAADIVARTHLDKKARAGVVEYALPRSLGEMAGADTGWAVALPDAFVTDALENDSGR